MKTVTNGFHPGDRYRYDFGLLTTGKGWAQIDTRQDASYFGQWINPIRREIFCYCEGDTSLTKVDTDAELLQEVQAIKDFDVTNYGQKAAERFGIDPGFSEPLKSALVTAGLGEHLH